MIFDRDYAKLAKLTESSNFIEIAERYKVESSRGLLENLDSIAYAIGLVDKFKKSIFYGKNFVSSNTKVNVEFTDTEYRVIHAILGILTESGELVEALLKVLMKEQTLDEIKTNLGEEVGDLFWYQAILMDAIGTNENQIKQRNLNKLICKRYGVSFNKEGAVNRNLAEENKALADPNIPDEDQLMFWYDPKEKILDKVTGDYILGEEVFYRLRNEGMYGYFNNSTSKFILADGYKYESGDGYFLILINPKIVYDGIITNRYCLGCDGA